MSKKPTPFNNPFGSVKLPAKSEPVKAAPPKAPAPPPGAKKGKPAPVDEDARLFLEAIGEVEVVRAGKQTVGPPPPRTADQLALRGDEAESLARLAELVVPDGGFELAGSDTFLEGGVQGLDPNLLKRLRGGDFRVDATLDLHGKDREEGRQAVEQFVGRARVAGHRCVLIVTGRGLNSEGQVPVLKQGLQEWLTRGRPAKQVLAFCSARPKDGGLGAAYVLLRR